MNQSFTFSKAFVWCLVLASIMLPGKTAAQFPYFQSFKDTTTPGLVISGAAKLTARTVDAPGSGYLRLTDTLINQVGCVYAEDSFPSQSGIVATFEFFTYNRTGSSPADGFSFFLFDAGINAFRAGPTGGSLGYAQKYSTPGLGKGYIGVGIDEFGNFSVISDGNKNGGTTLKVKPAVVIRGPGNGASATDYPYITGVQTDVAPHVTPFNGFAQRYYDSSTANYRRIKIILKPGSTLGAAGYTVTVVMYKGAGIAGTAVVSDTLINSYDYPYIAPAKLQYGLIASTGSVVAFHEVRNMQIDAYNAASLTAPTLNNDTSTVCSGNVRTIDITANDVSNNSGGMINKSSVDLDPATAGIQNSFTDTGKGTYSVDAGGIVSFTPDAAYTGISSITYTAKDNYGVPATTSGTIAVTITSGSALTLNITDPAGVCGSGVVNITSAAVTAGSTSGMSFSYYGSLSNALAGTANINSTAGAITLPGTYYIRGDYSGCSIARPVNVTISATPTTASAGGNQSLCISSNLIATLQANTPTAGTGVWSQVNGPGTATIAIPMSSNTPVQLPQVAGTYLMRWSISNGACPASTSDLTLTVSALATTATTGGNHAICNATTYTLSGSTPVAPSTGAWTVPYNNSGSAPTFSNTNSPAALVSNLAAGSTYSFQWKTTNGACSSTALDTLRISLPASAASITTPTQNLCGGTSAMLQATAPGTGTGGWSELSGPAAVIASPAAVSTNITSLSGGNNYVFRWTVTNGACSSAADVAVNDYAMPSASTNGGNQSLSGATGTTLTGNIPATGTGLWSQISGPAATITAPSSPNTTVTGMASGNTYDFRWTISNGSCADSYSNLTVADAVPLPIKLVRFEGMWYGEDARISWQTAAERSAGYYEVTRSPDGQNFEPVGRVKPAGGTGNTPYFYTDIHPDGNILFYRLKEVDLGGSVFYSEIVLLQRRMSNAAHTQPSPFAAQLTIDLDLQEAMPVTATLHDMTGRAAFQSMLPADQGLQRYTIGGLDGLAPGMYMLHVQQGGKTLLRERVVKQ